MSARRKAGVKMTKIGAATAATRLQQKAILRPLARSSGLKPPFSLSGGNVAVETATYKAPFVQADQ
jgi:hypothetical protein